MDRVDAVVIGAGVVGLAVARALAIAGRDVVILEAEDAMVRIRVRAIRRSSTQGSTTQGSLKARACIEGRERLYAYCAVTECRTDAAAS